jgi:hypothetical protein
MPKPFLMNMQNQQKSRRRSTRRKQLGGKKLKNFKKKISHGKSLTELRETDRGLTVKDEECRNEGVDFKPIQSEDYHG